MWKVSYLYQKVHTKPLLWSCMCCFIVVTCMLSSTGRCVKFFVGGMNRIGALPRWDHFVLPSTVKMGIGTGGE